MGSGNEKLNVVYVFRELHWERSGGADELVKYVAATTLGTLLEIRDKEEGRASHMITERDGYSIVISNSGESLDGGGWTLGRAFTVLESGEKYYFEVAKIGVQG